MTVTIFHNPACGTSRNTLAVIRETGVEPVVIDYLEAGWTRSQLETLLTEMGKAPRDILRVKNTPAEALGLVDPTSTDSAILDAMVAHPILVERPIVQSPKGTALCRPSEKVFDLLDNLPAQFTKEDGETVTPGR